MARRLYALIVLQLCLPVFAQAAETVPDLSASDPSCACVAQGKRWAQGDEACISGLLMVCGMNQNISAWQSLAQSCVVSGRYLDNPKVKQC